MRTWLLRFFVGAVILAATSVASEGQDLPPLGSPTRLPLGVGGVGSVIVYLRTEDGQKLPEDAVPLITISADFSNTPLPHRPQVAGDGWLFTGLPIANDYHVIVRANGYQTASEGVELPNSPGTTSSVMIFLKPVDQALLFHPPTGLFVLAPKLQKEIQHALEDLAQAKVASAQKHAAKALELAPANPYVQYVMGMVYLLSNQLDRAKPYLEKSVSIDPSQPVALGALGALRYQQGDDEGAVQVLVKAVELDPSSWKDEWYLACAYLRRKKYPDSVEHAEKALKLGREKARLAEIVLGQAQAHLGQREEAMATLEAFAKENPNDPNTKDVLRWIDLLRHAPAAREKPRGEAPASSSPASPWLTSSLPRPSVEVPPRQDWAPPDIDAARPLLVSTATCPLEQILKKAGANAEQLVATLQEFSATETFQGIEIKPGGQLARPDEHDFTYLVFIDQVSPQAFDVKEFRNEGTAQARLPGRVQDTGVPAMALAFHPIIQPDLEWKCEGLGAWNDQPAWVVRFEQKPDKPSVLATFSAPSEDYSLPLKGRAWVSERGSQVLHLETDLVKPIEPINLKRQHFSIDYKQVSFRTQKVGLWLPQSVDTYMQYQGHFLHYYHHFSDFKLFWVGATQKIGNPREAKSEEQ